MKKIFKCLGVASLVACLGLTSGCSCSVKQEKIDERATAIKKTTLLLNEDDKQRDFTTVYTTKTTNNKDDSITTGIVTVKYDAEDKKAYLSSVVKYKNGNDEERELSKTSHTVFVEEGKAVIVDDETEAKTITTFVTAYDVIVNSNKYSSLFDGADFYGTSIKLYDTYKAIPFNACTSSKNDIEAKGKAQQLPGISSVGVGTMTCDVDKKLFGKEYTFAVEYEMSIKESTVMSIVAEKNGDLSSVTREIITAVGTEGMVKKELIEFEVSFDSVD